MFNIVVLIKLMEDLRKVLGDIEVNKYTLDALSAVRISKSLSIALKLGKAFLKKEEAKAMKVETLSDKAMAKAARAALLSIKVKSTVVKADVKVESPVVKADIKVESPVDNDDVK